MLLFLTAPVELLPKAVRGAVIAKGPSSTRSTRPASSLAVGAENVYPDVEAAAVPSRTEGLE